MSGKVADAKCLAHSRYSVSYSYWFGGRGWDVWFGFGEVVLFLFLGVFCLSGSRTESHKKTFFVHPKVMLSRRSWRG